VRRRHYERGRDQFPTYLINCSLHWHHSEATASTLRLTPTLYGSTLTRDGAAESGDAQQFMIDWN
jgi:hypothetical protein